MWKVIVFFIIIIIIVFVIFQYLYNKNLFSPSTEQNDLKGLEYDDFFLGVKKGDVLSCEQKNQEIRLTQEYINVWTFEKFDIKKQKIVLFFHGNSGNISHRSYIIDICKRLGVNLMLVDYRGYGKSDGKPETASLCRDDEVAYEYISQKYTPEQIVVWGESLGGAVATYVASKYKVRSLVLLSTFSSLHDVVNLHPNVGAIVKATVSGYIRITGDDLNSNEWIKNIRCPVVMVHSTEDDVINFKSAKKLFRAIPGNHKKLIRITGQHSKPKITDSQLNQIFAFIGIKNHNIENLAQDLENMVDNREWG